MNAILVIIRSFKQALSPRPWGRSGPKDDCNSRALLHRVSPGQRLGALATRTKPIPIRYGTGRRFLQLLVGGLLLLTACTPAPTSTPTIVLPTVTPTEAPTATPVPPSPDATAAAFLNAWGVRDYAAMYLYLSPESRSTIDLVQFTQRYQRALSTAGVLTVTTRLQSALQQGDDAYVSFQTTLDTALVGSLVTDTVMSLSLHGERWLVDWDAGLIWPQLTGDRYFRIQYAIPARANIYDRAGLALATQGTIVTVGVIPAEIEDEDALLAALALVTGLAPDEIRGQYVAAPAEWRIPIADIPAQVSVDHNDALSIPGIYREEKSGRTYPRFEDVGAAPHVVGWVSPVPAERLAEYRARGYRGDEWVGVAGLEAWGEEILAGLHGGTLEIVDAAGGVIAVVAERGATPSRSIYVTFDRGFQGQVQKILGGRRGAIVVLDVHSGAIRALASGPGFDPNVFVGPAGAVGRSQILADPERPLFNRATNGAYPMGSVFKIITISAGMEAAALAPHETFFHCTGFWDGLGASARKSCWKETGHGDINLKDGLTASCNVVFYEVGKILDGLGQDVLPDYAKAFGFGTLTGLQGVVESGGLVPDLTWKTEVRGENWWVGDTVNLAIGQGNLTATPLQVARMMAAVANGGTLYRPYVVERISAIGETIPEQVTQSEVVGSLPVSAEHLAVIQDALWGVTSQPLGTAVHRYIGLPVSVAGKTGTAEAGGSGGPHSWFAAYAPADVPEIAVAVIVENGGEGSTVAAPLARQVIEAYFGFALSPLPPQAEEDYVPPTPTP